MDFEEIVHEFWDYEKNTVDPKTLHRSSKERAWWRCAAGHSWDAVVSSVVIAGSRCPYCSGRKRITGVNDLYTLHPEIVDELWVYDKNIGVDPRTIGPQSVKKVWWTCPQGHQWESSIAPVVNGRRCPYCQGRKVLQGFNDLATTHPEVVASLWSPNNTVSPREITRGSKKKVLWCCEEGHEWLSPVKSVATLGYGCSVCAGRTVIPGVNDLKSSYPEIVEKFWDYSSNTIDPSTVSSGAKYVANWSCGVHSWTAWIYDVTRGTRCPYCAKASSNGEQEVFQYLKDTLPEGTEVLQHYRGLLGRREIDIYLPEYQLAIEYNGAFYHSTYSRPPGADRKKRDDLFDLGIRYYGIWDDDWKTKRGIVERHLLSILGLASDKVYARKTKVHKITYEEASKFLESYHLRGSVPGTYYLGLKTGPGDLVAVMVLTKKSDGTAVLDRYATSVRVVGGHSKLVAYAEESYDFSEMVTFADLMVSNGDLYRSTGWDFDSRIPADYYCVRGSGRYHKFNYRIDRFRTDPSLIFEEGATELRLQEMNNIYRVYDAGKLRFTKKNTNYRSGS